MTEPNTSKAAIARRIRLEALRARARAELSPLPPAQSYRFRPLAAAAGDFAMPDALLAQNDPLVAITVQADETHIRLNIASQGFARTQTLRNRAARLANEDGALDLYFIFDGQGRGEIMVPRTREIERALGGPFTLDVAE